MNALPMLHIFAVWCGGSPSGSVRLQMAASGARWWHFEGSRPLALLLLAGVCVGALYTEGAALLGTRSVKAQDLETPPIGRYAEVKCDDLEHAVTFENGQKGYLCRLGRQLLPVVGGTGTKLDGPHGLHGRMREFRRETAYGRSDTGDVDFIWPDEIRSNPAVTTAYLEIKTLWPGRVISLLGIMVGIAVIALMRRWRMRPWSRS